MEFTLKDVANGMATYDENLSIHDGECFGDPQICCTCLAGLYEEVSGLDKYYDCEFTDNI